MVQNSKKKVFEAYIENHFDFFCGIDQITNVTNADA